MTQPSDARVSNSARIAFRGTGVMLPHCDRCGQFHKGEPGSSYAMRFSGWPLTPDHEATRCLKCTESFGPIEASHGVAEWTAGIVADTAIEAIRDCIGEDGK